MYISIHSLCSILCWCTFGSNYSLKSFWIWCHKLGTPIFGQFCPFLFGAPLKLHQVGWKASVHSHFQISPEMFNRIQSGLWLGHSRTFIDLSWSHSFEILALCLGSLPCWKMNRRPSLRSRALWSRFSARMSLYIAAIFPSILTSLPVPGTEKHPHSMMLPPPCFTVGMVLPWWWAMPGFLQTWRLAFTPKSSIFVSSDQRILFLMVWKSFRCILANSRRAAMCLLLRSGFRLATLPYRPDWWIAAEMVVLPEGSPLSTDHVQSTEFTTGRLQLSSILSFMAKAVNT